MEIFGHLKYFLRVTIECSYRMIEQCTETQNVLTFSWNDRNVQLGIERSIVAFRTVVVSMQIKFGHFSISSGMSFYFKVRSNPRPPHPPSPISPFGSLPNPRKRERERERERKDLYRVLGSYLQGR
jgi:hypothetical protein